MMKGLHIFQRHQNDSCHEIILWSLYGNKIPNIRFWEMTNTLKQTPGRRIYINHVEKSRLIAKR